MTKRIATVLLGLIAAGAVALPASAAWVSNGTWHPDNRWEHHTNNYYYGYSYRPPPVAYAAPYNYGYVPPPVVYQGTPGFSLTIRP